MRRTERIIELNNQISHLAGYGNELAMYRMEDMEFYLDWNNLDVLDVIENITNPNRNYKFDVNDIAFTIIDGEIYSMNESEMVDELENIIDAFDGSFNDERDIEKFENFKRYFYSKIK